MSPDTTRELSTAKIDSLIADMQEKAEDGEEGFTDECFKDAEIKEVIRAIRSFEYLGEYNHNPQYQKFTRIPGDKEGQWKTTNYILNYSPTERKLRIIYPEGRQFPTYENNNGKVRILENPDFAYIQIFSPKSKSKNTEDKLILEIFFLKPRDLSIIDQIRQRVLKNRDQVDY